jgi:hypothetical protein
LLDVTSFQPSEMIVLLRTMTAPNGPPLFVRIFSLFDVVYDRANSSMCG